MHFKYVQTLKNTFLLQKSVLKMWFDLKKKIYFKGLFKQENSSLNIKIMLIRVDIIREDCICSSGTFDDKNLRDG